MNAAALGFRRGGMCAAVIALLALCAMTEVQAAKFGVGCGLPGAGDCFKAGFTPYCDDLCGGVPCVGCCELVCAGDPFCCNEETGAWDGFCAGEAQDICNCVAGQDEPPNDDCSSAIELELGDTEISNHCATISDPEHAAAECNDGPDGLVGMGYDVWFTFNSGFRGSLEISTCDQLDASWDTQLAVYEGCDCLDLSDPPLACNQDGIECANGSSRLFVDVVPNTCYIIRIGSTFIGAFGSGMLSLIAHFCPDFNGDGIVGPFDLATILGSWGPCDDCVADLNGDGIVGPLDLATLLAAWGPC